MKYGAQTAFVAAMVVAALLRLSSLTIRPLHHDEGVNTLFLLQFVRDGVYRYDPSNYHGPLLYYMVAPLLSVFGFHTALLRVWPAVIGVLTIAVFWALRGVIGRWGAVTAAWLVALSPISVYFSRDLIHESWLVGAAALLVGAAVRWGNSRRDGWVVLGWCAVALMFATKETTPMLLGAIAAGFVIAGLLRFGSQLPQQILSAVRGTSRAHMYGCVLSCVLLLLLYTKFLTTPSTFVDLFRAYYFWTKTGVEGSGHEKSWPYFFGMLWRYERMAWILGLGGLVLAMLRREAAAGIGVTAGLLLAAHAAIPYKTPWLALDFIPPLAASAGYLIERAGQALPSRLPRVMLGSMLAVGLAVLGQDAYRMSFVNYDDDAESFVYSQTRREFKGLVAAIEAVVATDSRTLAVPLAVMSSDHFPLNWHVRDMTAVSYWESGIGDVADGLIIVKQDRLDDIRQQLTRPHKMRSFMLRPGVELTLLIPDPMFAAARSRIDAPGTWRPLGGIRPMVDLTPVQVDVALAGGLVARSYALADFASTAVRIEPGRAPNIAFDHGKNTEWNGTHGIEWLGYLRAPNDGLYQFALSSDDGSTLEIGGQMIVDNWGQHSDRQRRGTVQLHAGLYSVNLRYIDYGGGARLHWLWRPPTASADAEVPATALAHDATLQ